jgi:DNA repair protein RecO (recombination protein O)
MHHKSRAIVLQTVKYGDTSAIARILTEKFGMLSFMVYGYRSSKSSKKAAILQQGTLLDLDFVYQANKGLQQIKEVKRAYTFQSIPFDMRKTSVLLFLIELVSKCTIEHHPGEEEFEFIYNKLLELDSEKNLNPLFHLEFMVLLTQHLGFYPENNFSDSNNFFDIRNGVFVAKPSSDLKNFNAEESALLTSLLASAADYKKYSKTIRNSFADKFLAYYAYHIDNFREIKSLKIFEDIFA